MTSLFKWFTAWREARKERARKIEFDRGYMFGAGDMLRLDPCPHEVIHRSSELAFMGGGRSDPYYEGAASAADDLRALLLATVGGDSDGLRSDIQAANSVEKAFGRKTV